MKKNTLKKALALLITLAMMIPFMPVIASATDYTYEYRTFTEADKEWYGDGSASEFTIDTVGEFAYFMSLGQGASPVTFNGKTIKLGDHIIWNEGTASSTGFVPESGTVIYKWSPYANEGTNWNQFRGVFDGQGYTISGLYVSEEKSYIGFIGITRGAEIKNLTIENSYFTSSSAKQYFGAVVGGVYKTNSATTDATVVSNVAVKNCHIDASNGAARSFTGGVVGGPIDNEANLGLTITNCVVDKDTTVTGTITVGGFVGVTRPNNVLTMTDCVNYATVTASNDVAGLVGTVACTATFTRCTSFGIVTASATGPRSAILVAMRYINGGTDVTEDTETEVLELPDKAWNCKYVSFIDCFYPNCTENSRNFPIWVANSKTMVPALRVLVFYSSECDNIDTTNIEGTSLNRAYHSTSSYITDTNATTGLKSEYNIASAFQNALIGTASATGAYPKARFDLDTPATGDTAVEVKGVQTRDNTDNTKFDARFVASVNLSTLLNTTDVKQIGFEISRLTDYSYADMIKSHVCPEVYTSIASSFGDTLTAAGEPFNADYLATMVVTGIPKDGAQVLLVRSYYNTTTDDANRVYGTYALVTFVNGKIVDTRYLTEFSAVAEAGLMLASPLSVDSYDMEKLFPNATRIVSVKQKDGPAVDTIAPLAVGVNTFEVTYHEGSKEVTRDVTIIRRDKHRVVFNSNGGSYIETKYVDEGAKITYDASVTPTRANYDFAGWYNDKGEPVDFDRATFTADTVLTARWDGPNAAFGSNHTDYLSYTTSSAALNIVWKDYDNAFGYRPASVTCTLSDGTNSYKVIVTKTSAAFVDDYAPNGATITQGAGNWTVKIKGLSGNYTFVQDAMNNEYYTTVQSGTSVEHTLVGYSPLHDDTAALMTQNGRFYDHAGNVIVLKGVVTLNVGWQALPTTTSVEALKRLKEEGVNCIRVTMMTEDANGVGYLNDSKRAELMKILNTVIQNASSLGMYCIVDFGVLMTGNNANSDAYLEDLKPYAISLFETLAEDHLNNPYVLFEICNEPAFTQSNPWSAHIKPFEEAIIRAIRAKGSKAVIIAAPNMYARRLSDTNNDDPINKPFATEIAYNVAYSFHCYAYTLSFNHNANPEYNYGWRLSDGIKAGLTIVSTEFSPATASIKAQTTGGLLANTKEADKYLNIMLENDVSYMLFRYTSANAAENTSSQHMFTRGNMNALIAGTWSRDMLTDSGKWFYDNALNSTGFIKAADFTYEKPLTFDQHKVNATDSHDGLCGSCRECVACNELEVCKICGICKNCCNTKYNGVCGGYTGVCQFMTIPKE